MEINGTNNSGAATFAMKKALETPSAVMNVVQNAGASHGETQAMKSKEPQPVDLSAVTGKGKLLDVTA